MNGRIYDPLLGRMLSADVVIQFPGDLQSYNRYSYVQNNPLSLTDPSGFQVAIASPGLMVQPAIFPGVGPVGGTTLGLNYTLNRDGTIGPSGPGQYDLRGTFADNWAATKSNVKHNISVLRSLFGLEAALDQTSIQASSDSGRIAETITPENGSPATSTGQPVETLPRENESYSPDGEVASASVETLPAANPSEMPSTTGSAAPALDISLSTDVKTGAAHGNSIDNQAPSGNYTNTHESGKTYSGVGLIERALASADRIAKAHNDPVVSTVWTTATNKREAYIQEHNDIEANGRAGNKAKIITRTIRRGKDLRTHSCAYDEFKI